VLTVRALVYFTKNISSRGDLEEEFSFARGVLSTLEEGLKSLGFSVFSKRISFPGLSRDLALRLVDYTGRGVYVSVGYSRDFTVDDIVELTSSGVYVPVLSPVNPSRELAEKYVEAVTRTSQRDPLAATRVAIGFHGEDFLTPYYPDSSSPGFRLIGVSLLYPRALLSTYKSTGSLSEAFKQVFSRAEVVARVVGETSGLPVRVDYSLSPWMSESVAELYEEAGYSLLEPGGLYYTWLLNKHISEYSSPDLRTGFNEVMLPYTEDNKLKEYGERGLLSARRLLYYASTCVAGLDMAVLPEDRGKLLRLVLDAMSLSVAKNKPMSLRVVPVSGRPGDRVKLGVFGEVTVLDY
jgi:uncharacterized protein (UPF0210 family)